MSKQIESINSELAEWIARQKIFFVASAPLSADGHVNCSPKGGDSFRVLNPLLVAYADYTGSGAETVAHIRENGRILIMFCAFEGTPQIARLHGRGEIIEPHHPDFADLANRFPSHAGVRVIVRVSLTRVSTSCGYSVPFFDYRAHRDTLDRWTASKGPEAIRAYRRQKNQTSIDGLPALTATSPGQT